MTSDNTTPSHPERDPGTPIYDELAGTHSTEEDTAPPAAAADETAVPVPEPRPAGDLVPPVTVLDLFGRMKDLEEGDGSWNGGDVVEALCEWFAEFGIDVDADEVAAAASLRLPAWLARTLTAPPPAESGLVIHVRTDRDRPLDATRAYLAALVWGLGEDTSASVFDLAGDQIAHIVHPAAEH
ncbi:hypothetical protein [Amycolatopsis sp. NPDC004378]